MVILPFDPNLDTILLTDASRLHGMGFALVQIKKGNMRLIQCALDKGPRKRARIGKRCTVEDVEPTLDGGGS